MTAQIRFSVVIPAWNAAHTIARALQSCMAQSYPACEVIVVDDASTDITGELIRSSFPEVRYIRLEQNAGPAHARNTGWDAATGNFIAFLDADDIWHPDKLQLIAGVLTQNSRVRFLFHTFKVYPAGYDAGDDNLQAEQYPFRKLLWRNPIATPCAVLINDTTLRFDEQMRYMEDYDLWLRAAEKYGVFRLRKPLTSIGRPILSAGGQSSNRLQMRRGEWKAYIKMAKRHPQYWLLMPLLIGFSAVKHIFKSLLPRP